MGHRNQTVVEKGVHEHSHQLLDDVDWSPAQITHDGSGGSHGALHTVFGVRLQREAIIYNSSQEVDLLVGTDDVFIQCDLNFTFAPNK